MVRDEPQIRLAGAVEVAELLGVDAELVVELPDDVDRWRAERAASWRRSS